MPSEREKETEISPHFLISRSTKSPQWTPSIPYNRSITPSGAITYSIPIETAKGYKYAPQIALTYNSQSGNGIVGYGWELSGLSNIV
ncbi:SpvB/TcaC N-terminal domain-containing protein [uncultured Porphyromonas sp.]|uniref:SpvB/TcaC N-terminal domain-containing protein n=1 Tax=uncultured Porphyromonas sp. TaxID=159274 RepID=UPI002614D842|nr:SpvB/TcaC N-terminal domain-containing protein [uncultured Porphyromonas sp.]